MGLAVKAVRLDSALVVATVVAFGSWGLYENRASKAEAEKARAAVAALAASVDARPLGTSLIETRTIVEHDPMMAAPSASAAAASVASKEEREAAAAAAESQRMSAIAGRFRDEPVDSSWSRAMESQISSGVRSVRVAGAEIDSVECHSTLCRLQGVYDNTDDYNQLLLGLIRASERNPDSAIGAHGELRATALDVGPDGRQRNEIFIARPGENLPTM